MRWHQKTHNPLSFLQRSVDVSCLVSGSSPGQRRNRDLDRRTYTNSRLPNVDGKDLVLFPGEHKGMNQIMGKEPEVAAFFAKHVS